MCAQLLSCVQLSVTPWTVACQAPPSMGFPRQEHWSGLPLPSPGDLPHSGIEPASLHWQAHSLPLHYLGSPFNSAALLFFLIIWNITSIFQLLLTLPGFPVSSAGKESTCNAGDPGLIPGLGRSAGEGIGCPLQYSWASLVAQLVKNLPAMWETWVGKIPWRRERLPTPVFWPGESVVS